jgi:AcrR family transcriptional regulator
MPIANQRSKRRKYESPLREQQAAATRDRILEGLVRTMADGLAEVSMPAVARAADVSVATVYRHFPSKQALFDATPEYIGRRTGADTLRPPGSYEELARSIETVYRNIEGVDDVMRAAMESPLGDVARRAQMPARLCFLDDTVEALAGDLAEPARGRLARLLLVLTSSGAQRMLSAAGLDARSAADDIAWAVRTIIEAETAKT